MAIDLTKFVKGKNLNSADFSIDDAAKTVKVKTDAASSVGIALAAIKATAAETIAGDAADKLVGTADLKATLGSGANYRLSLNVTGLTGTPDVHTFNTTGFTATGNTLTGVYSVGSSGTVDASGVFSAVQGTVLAGVTNNGSSRAISGLNNATGGTNIGVYGNATGGAINWAGWFDGNTKTTGSNTSSSFIATSLLNAPFVKTDATGLLAAGSSASTTTEGTVRLSTNAETLTPTAPSKTTTAVSPDDMSYALQTGQDYPINLGGTINSYMLRSGGGAIFGNATLTKSPGGFPHISINGANPTLDIVGDSISYYSALRIYTQAYGANFGLNLSNYGGGARLESTGLIQLVPDSAGTPTARFLSTGFTSTVAITAPSYITSSDATLKEDVQAIDIEKAKAFKAGLRWVSYELFSEQQVEVMKEVVTKEVVDGEEKEVASQVGTGVFEVKRTSQGRTVGLIAQEVRALAEQLGDFGYVVKETADYFDLDLAGKPKLDKSGNRIVLKRLGIDYDALSWIIAAGDQA